jgi:hypothetical protein
MPKGRPKRRLATGYPCAIVRATAMEYLCRANLTKADLAELLGYAADTVENDLHTPRIVKASAETSYEAAAADFDEERLAHYAVALEILTVEPLQKAIQAAFVRAVRDADRSAPILSKRENASLIAQLYSRPESVALLQLPTYGKFASDYSVLASAKSRGANLADITGTSQYYSACARAYLRELRAFALKRATAAISKSARQIESLRDAKVEAFRSQAFLSRRTAQAAWRVADAATLWKLIRPVAAQIGRPSTQSSATRLSSGELAVLLLLFGRGMGGDVVVPLANRPRR